MEIAQLVVTAVVSILASSGFTGLVLAILNRRWSKKDEDNPLKVAVRALLMDRIEYLGECYIYAKEIRLEDKENMHRLYDAAKGLGMNGDCKTIMAEVDKLRLKEKAE